MFSSSSIVEDDEKMLKPRVYLIEEGKNCYTKKRDQVSDIDETKE